MEAIFITSLLTIGAHFAFKPGQILGALGDRKSVV